ncbi:hypothetical protein [Streptomyces sp. SM13]|uniref:hypothetical protein n=1 Tax=Streptomyces sp. SM13 TaxID=1983803 RepID=UPI000CD545EA|nr:hypothetical protein [Streptomyces sp. SM13]
MGRDRLRRLLLVRASDHHPAHRPLTVGGLDRAACLETTTAFLIGLRHSGHDPHTPLPPPTAVRP